MSKSGKSILVLGGARSGKSSYAESLSDDWAGPRVYIATAQAFDDEMAARIKTHRNRRSDDWTTIETMFDLPGTLRDAVAESTFILIDCLTLWLTNLMLADKDADQAVDALLDALRSAPGTIVLVSNEVGSGIVPENALARRFRDLAGITNQRIAQAVDEVILVTAGLPMRLKPARS
jgi:adenosylcobinamide kinase / adenosylcobinamide-phosphate guanylyltransferase